MVSLSMNTTPPPTRDDSKSPMAAHPSVSLFLQEALVEGYKSPIAAHPSVTLFLQEALIEEKLTYVPQTKISGMANARFSSVRKMFP
jgi:hypothetical protein